MVRHPAASSSPHTIPLSMFVVAEAAAAAAPTAMAAEAARVWLGPAPAPPPPPPAAAMRRAMRAARAVVAMGKREPPSCGCVVSSSSRGGGSAGGSGQRRDNGAGPEGLACSSAVSVLTVDRRTDARHAVCCTRQTKFVDFSPPTYVLECDSASRPLPLISKPSSQ